MLQFLHGEKAVDENGGSGVEGAEAFHQRRVGIVEENVERMGREVAEVVAAEFFQGADEVFGVAGDFGGVGIGFVFVASAPDGAEHAEQATERLE